MYENNNPQGLKDGEPCFGLNLQAIRNAYTGMPVELTKPVSGTAVHDPNRRSKNPADNPAAHFLPDDPHIFGQPVTSHYYSLDNWFITKELSKAEKKREQVLRELVENRMEQMRTFSRLLDEDTCMDIANCYPPTLLGLLQSKGDD